MARAWVRGGVLVGARTRKARIAHIADLAMNVSEERAASALADARLSCSNSMENAARHGGLGDNVSVRFVSESSGTDMFLVGGIRNYSVMGTVWPNICSSLGGTPANVCVADNITASISDFLPGVRNMHVAVPHEIVNARAVEMLSADISEIKALRRRNARKRALEWARVFVITAVWIAVLVLMARYYGITPLRYTHLLRAVGRAAGR